MTARETDPSAQEAVFYGGPLDGERRALPAQDDTFAVKALRADRRWVTEAPSESPVLLRTYTYRRMEQERGQGPGGSNVFRLVLHER